MSEDQWTCPHCKGKWPFRYQNCPMCVEQAVKASNTDLPLLKERVEMVLQKLESMDSRLTSELTHPRPMVLMDKQVYYKEKQEIQAEATKAGVDRGERNTLYYLHELVMGRIELAQLNFEGWAEPDVKRFKEILEWCQIGFARKREVDATSV